MPTILWDSLELSGAHTLKLMIVGKMNREYDAFEVLPDGTLIWKAKIVGHENAIKKLKEIAKDSPNEFRLMHIPTKTVIATIIGKSARDEWEFCGVRFRG